MKKIYNAPNMKVAELDLADVILNPGSLGVNSETPATGSGSGDNSGEDNDSRTTNLWDQEW